MMVSDGILSQEEIDALLRGEVRPGNVGSEDDAENAFAISDFDRDTLGEVGNISLGTSATALSTLLNKKVSITTPEVYITTHEQLRSDYPLPYVVIEVKYTKGLEGTNILIIKEEDACVIANLMMGGDGGCESNTLSEIELSAVKEAMNQMMGSATTSLSSMFNRRIEIAPPELTVVDLGEERLELSSNYKEVVAIKFKMDIEDLINSEMIQILPVEAAKNIIGLLVAEDIDDRETGAKQDIATSEPVVSQEQDPDFLASGLPGETKRSLSSLPETSSGRSSADYPSGLKEGEKVTVQPARFAPLVEEKSVQLPKNIGLIMDVPLDVSVELGRTRKTIKEILELGQGSIIELDKLAGEPVDLLVNGKLIARGEVVVIDENYGIRITAIISQIDRVNKLQ